MVPDQQRASMAAMLIRLEPADPAGGCFNYSINVGRKHSLRQGCGEVLEIKC